MYRGVLHKLTWVALLIKLLVCKGIFVYTILSIDLCNCGAIARDCNIDVEINKKRIKGFVRLFDNEREDLQQ